MSLSVPMSSQNRKIWEKIKFAFRVTPSEPLSEQDLELIGRIAGHIHRRGLAAPAILALQSVKPLNFLGSQVMIAMKPIVEMLISGEEYERFSAIIERRDGFEMFIERIERLESTSKDE